MKRRTIFQALAGLLGAKALPAAPVSPCRSAGEARKMLADRAASNPLFNDTRHFMGLDNKTGKVSLYSYVMTPDNRVLSFTRITN